jgi:hypothetical protein
MLESKDSNEKRTLSDEELDQDAIDDDYNNCKPPKKQVLPSSKFNSTNL